MDHRVPVPLREICLPHCGHSGQLGLGCHSGGSRAGPGGSGRPCGNIGRRATSIGPHEQQGVAGEQSQVKELGSARSLPAEGNLVAAEAFSSTLGGEWWGAAGSLSDHFKILFGYLGSDM